MESKPSPYQEALTWIESHPTTGSARSLAKLILSLWNDDCCYSFRECIDNLDAERTAIALRAAAHFARIGEDAELVKIGHTVCDSYPGLWELAAAANKGKDEKRREWEEEGRREREALYPE